MYRFTGTIVSWCVQVGISVVKVTERHEKKKKQHFRLLATFWDINTPNCAQELLETRSANKVEYAFQLTGN